MKLTEIVSNVLGSNDVELREDMTAADVEGWDSLSHVQIILACETKLGVRFNLAEIANLELVGDLVELMNKYSKTQT